MSVVRFCNKLRSNKCRKLFNRQGFRQLAAAAEICRSLEAMERVAEKRNITRRKTHHRLLFHLPLQFRSLWITHSPTGSTRFWRSDRKRSSKCSNFLLRTHLDLWAPILANHLLRKQWTPKSNRVPKRSQPLLNKATASARPQRSKRSFSWASASPQWCYLH